MESVAQRDQVVTHVIGDPAHHGLAAAAFDYPPEWRAESQLVWNLKNRNGLALIFARAFDPNGPEMWQLFPTQDCYALASGFGAGFMGGSPMGDPFGGIGQMLTGLFGGGQPAPARFVAEGFAPPGPQHVALGNLAFGPEQAAPMTPEMALPRFVIPKFRGHLPDLRILGVMRAPEIGPQLGFAALANVPHDGAVARIAYTLNGTAIEEQFFCGGYCLAPNGGQQNWGLLPIMSFRAAAGGIDSLMQRLGWVAHSVRVNPQFEAVVAQLGMQMQASHQALLAGMQQDMLATEAREMQARAAYFDWRQEIQAGLQAQSWQSFNDRVEGFGDAMMGRTPYVDPSSWTGQPHYDHGHHPYVWTDGQGNFRHSHDPNFDPNVGSDRSWTVAGQPAHR